MKISGLFLLLLLGFCGCSSIDTAFDAATDLRAFKHIYVQSSQNDSNHLDELIANELKRLGFDASAGVRTMMPNDSELVILYESQWNWDFNTYLIQLDVTVRDVRSEKQVGQGRIFHGSFKGKSPEQMVAGVLAPMFGPKKSGKK
jgi:hypothetical protein